MKKWITLLVLIALISSLFAGCNKEFDWDESVEKLEKKGLTVSIDYTSEAALASATALFNSEIALEGGNFTVELKRTTILIQDGDHAKNCQFLEFATEEQAKEYAEFYLSTRAADSQWKVARSGCVVVLTNLQTAVKTVNLDFQ